jgi:hypothetical protein
MKQLEVNTAYQFVQTVLDELTNTGEAVDLAADTTDIEKLVESVLVEAVITTHTGAPSVLVDGVVGTEGEDYISSLNDGVVKIEMQSDALRVVSVQASDSTAVVTDILPEASPEARKQLNKHTRGVYDDPAVVMCKRREEDYKPVLKYYSAKEETCPDMTVEYVPYPVMNGDAVEVCPRLEYAVLNEVAAAVLDALKESQKAAIYRTKSKSLMGLS